VNAQERWEEIDRRRRTARPPRRLPAPKVYSPRLRRDQIKAIYFLKRFEGRPMTKLVQEAVDRYLAEHGGAGEVIERGIANFGDPGEEARRDRGAR
jgi:hypothetical protein